jgi:hypothetical protein
VKTLLTLLFTLFLALPAHAEFTTDEATQIENIRLNAARKLHQALASYTVAIQQNEDTLAMRRSAILQTNYAVNHVMRGMSKLVDVVEVLQFHVPNPATRASRVAAAWDDFDNAVFYIDRALGVLNAARGTNMLQAKNAWLLGAKNAIKAINQNLSYHDARPLSYPAIIGPHGNYDLVQAMLARAWAYHFDIVNYAFTAYGQGNPAPNANWYLVLQSSYQNYNVFADGLALMAGVGQTNVSQFWRVVNYQKRLTDQTIGSVASRYRGITMALTMSPHAALQIPIGRVTESWNAMDKAIWQMLVFLNCEMVRDPQGCAAAVVGP